MSYLAAFTQDSAVGKLRIPVRIPTDDAATAVAVCIGLIAKPDVSDVEIVGREAPRQRSSPQSSIKER